MGRGEKNKKKKKGGRREKERKRENGEETPKTKSTIDRSAAPFASPPLHKTDGKTLNELRNSQTGGIPLQPHKTAEPQSRKGVRVPEGTSGGKLHYFQLNTV